MPFIRLSDNYIDHPKFLALSASAFRLWHEGMAFCRKHQTDGLIPMSTLQGFRYYQPVRVKELAAPYLPAANPLWETVDGFGYKVHDYLFWNLSKEEEDAEKDGATARMRALRKRRRDDQSSRAGDAVCSPEQVGERSPSVTPLVPPSVTSSVTPFVLDRTGSDRIGSEKRDPEHPVAVFIQQTYPTVYAKCRHGATFRVREAKDFEVCRDLVETYGDRVGLLLEYFLQLPPGKDVINQPGTPRQFQHMAPTCDSELRKHGR